MPSLKCLTDQQLLSLYIQGDNRAFERLLEKYKEVIYNTIYYIVKDRHLSEDIFQETFIRVIDSLRARKYSHDEKFGAWVKRIAQNLCLDHLRKMKRRPLVVTTDNRDIFDTLKFSTPAVEQKPEAVDDFCTVKAMLDQLPKAQKEVVVLRHFGDLSFKEIAEITDCSLNTALGRMRYGLINLRKIQKGKPLVVKQSLT
jgi:RNA polymerase sigma factor (sigma-70 family)